MNGWTGADRGMGGPGRRQGVFPTVATVPGPKNATGSTAGAPWRAG